MNVNLHVFPELLSILQSFYKLGKKKSLSSHSVVNRDPSQAEGALSAWQSHHHNHHKDHERKKLHSYCIFWLLFFFLVHFLGLSLQGIRGRQ